MIWFSQIAYAVFLAKGGSGLLDDAVSNVALALSAILWSAAFVAGSFAVYLGLLELPASKSFGLGVFLFSVSLHFGVQYEIQRGALAIQAGLVRSSDELAENPELAIAKFHTLTFVAVFSFLCALGIFSTVV